MTDEYTAAQARHDQAIADLRTLCRLLWDAAADNDPTIRNHPIGRHEKGAA